MPADWAMPSRLLIPRRLTSKPAQSTSAAGGWLHSARASYEGGKAAASAPHELCFPIRDEINGGHHGPRQRNINALIGDRDFH